jgi:hypothetical protein
MPFSNQVCVTNSIPKYMPFSNQVCVTKFNFEACEKLQIEEDCVTKITLLLPSTTTSRYVIGKTCSCFALFL